MLLISKSPWFKQRFPNLAIEASLILNKNAEKGSRGFFSWFESYEWIAQAVSDHCIEDTCTFDEKSALSLRL